jgi:hypothetical protein
MGGLFGGGGSSAPKTIPTGDSITSKDGMSRPQSMVAEDLKRKQTIAQESPALTSNLGTETGSEMTPSGQVSTTFG